MFRVPNVILLSCIICLMALPAAAADNGFYIGGSVGRSDITTGELTTVDVEGDANGYKVFGGYRFLTFLSVEGTYADFGTIKDPARSSEVNMDGFGAQAVAYIPLGIADIFGKAGFFDWSADVKSSNVSAPISVKKDGTDPVYGAGIQFRIQSWAVRGEVEYYDIKGTDKVYMYSVGASYTF